jgi:hypothetical protein
MLVTQSSDAEFHCLAITVFYWQAMAGRMANDGKRSSQIDCAGAVPFDEGGIDMVIEMLEKRATTFVRGAAAPAGRTERTRPESWRAASARRARPGACQ